MTPLESDLKDLHGYLPRAPGLVISMIIKRKLVRGSLEQPEFELTEAQRLLTHLRKLPNV